MLKYALCVGLFVLALCANAAPPVAANRVIPDITIHMAIGSPYMTVNGERRYIDNEGSVPFIENDRTLVPFRAIFEALSIEVGWNDVTKEITGTRGSTVIRLTVGSTNVLRNGWMMQMDVAPMIVNDRTMVPVRFIAESVGAKVDWDDVNQSITIRYTPLHVNFDNIHINIGDEKSRVYEQKGAADRVDPGHGDFYWYVYNRDYGRFLMVGFRNGAVAALYTNARWFTTGYADYGDTAGDTEYGGWLAPHHPVVRVYRDSYRHDMAYAVLIVAADINLRRWYDEDFYRAQELQTFDVTNAFRHINGLQTLVWDDLAALTARQHSADMANYNYFSHYSRDGSPPWDRFSRNSGRYRALAENLGGQSFFPLSVTFFDNWINSQTGHREPILSRDYTRLGVGMAFNRNSRYVYYIGQIFYRP
jgi:uncharacterized protein YkwD